MSNHQPYKPLHFILTIGLFMACNFTLFAQVKGEIKGEDEEGKPTKIKLEQAGSLEGTTDNKGRQIRKLKGNVKFSQGETTMYCDSAIQYINSNVIDAFGHVRIKQGDSLNVTSNALHYDGNTKLAELTGSVVLVNKKTRVMTEQLNYQVDQRIAYYSSGATIRDGNNTLKSQKGFYNANTEYFGFKKDVNLVNPQYTIDCDTLNYNSRAGIAYFHGPTDIKSKSGTLYATDGEYNTRTGESFFAGSSAIENDEYKLIGDKLHYDSEKKTGFAEGDIALTLKGKNIIIYGDKGHYNENTGISKTQGNVVLKYLMGKDTLYLKADTMLSYQKGDTLEKIDAFPNVKIFREDLRGLCDSLSYMVSDSMINFYSEPILWASGSQLTGEQIKVTLDSSEIKQLFVNTDAFMVSEDTLKNYNQIKGKNMVAHFKKGDLELLDVLGNGQSIYFSLEGDTALTGMNSTLCGNMKIFLDSSKVKDILFVSQPEAHFVPPGSIKDPETKLPGFTWRIAEEPKFEEFIIDRKIKKPLPPKTKEEN